MMIYFLFVEWSHCGVHKPVGWSQPGFNVFLAVLPGSVS
jgi:hypothetical protein